MYIGLVAGWPTKVPASPSPDIWPHQRKRISIVGASTGQLLRRTRDTLGLVIDSEIPGFDLLASVGSEVAGTK